MTTLDPTWRFFQDLSSGAEAAACSEYCIFSLRTFEIASCSGTASFALTEQKQEGVWRWAIVNAGGRVVGEGFETTRSSAHEASADLLRTAFA